jgi:predicted amidohydrolase YtcJ
MHPDVSLRAVRLGLDGPLVDVAVADGRITAVAAPGAATPAADSLDADGATLLRGLWDCHVHSRQWALRRNSTDLSGAPTAARAAELTLAGAGDGTGPVLAYGANERRWPEPAHKDLLAGLARPALLMTQDLHTAWLNQAGLDRIGEGGHPTGVLREHACFAAVARLTAELGGTVDAWIAEAMRDAARLGVVGVIDFELSDNVADWGRRAEDGPLPVRVVCSIPRQLMDGAVDRGLRTGDQLDDPRLSVGPVKVFVDGSLGSRTALCDASYPGDPADFGRLELAPDELAAIMQHATEHGLGLAVHAIGDRANTVALDAFEQVGVGGRIEHAQLLADADVRRFADLGVVAGVQPAHLHDDRDTADALWSGRTGRAYAYRSLHAAGARVEFGSDAPVSALDPWRAISAAVTRAAAQRDSWHPEQRLAPAAALDCSARGRATPQAGDVADLILVSGLETIVEGGRPRVAATMLGGAWTYRT